jgi:hypothetical protein
MDKLSEKYVSNSEKEKPENKSKKVLSDDAFAVCEFIEHLINKIEHARMSLIR